MAAPLQSFPSVLHMLIAAAHAVPDRIAVICGGDSLTYKDYLGSVAALSRDLRQGGVKPGDRVATLLGNSADAAIATFGAQASGAQLVPLNPAYTAAELGPVLADAEPVALLYDQHLEDRVRVAAPPGTRLIAIGAKARRLSAETAPAAEILLPEPDWLSTLQYTGGTTGRSKGANLTHASVAINVAQREALLPTQDGEQVMCATPLFHVYAVSMGLYLAANCLGTLHIVAKFDAAAVLETIARARIGYLAASPTIFLALMAQEGFAATDLSALRVCSSGSAALPEDVLHRWEDSTGCPICEGYGQTEAGPVLTYNSLHGKRKPGTVGISVPLTQIEIVDTETGTMVLPLGEAGEIRARGPQIMIGYRNRPVETAEALRSGWLHTGDIGRLDAEGYLTICDRKKDMVVSAGYNVFPREVEEALFTHPGVADAAVIGVPDAYRGEALLAYVVRRDPDVTEKQLAVHIGERLTKYKWPREVRFLDSLPKTIVGKTDKTALRKP